MDYAAITGDQNLQDKSRYGNSVVIDDGGAGQQVYRNAQGVWYGNYQGVAFPSVTMPHYEGTADYTYAQGNYAAAYTSNNGITNPASELVRDVFYVRGPDYVITYDRATTTQPQFTKQLQWNFIAAPVVSGNSWTATDGTSKLFGQTYSDAALTTTSRQVNYSNTTVQEVQTVNTAPAASVQYVTAMQVASSGVASMDPSTHLETADAKLEGVQMGAYVVLFGKRGTVSGGTTYQVTAAAGQTMTHYLTDLVPGTNYTLAGANQAHATVDSQGVLTFTSSGTGRAQTIALI